MAKEARITISEPVFGAGQASIVLRPVNLLCLEKLLPTSETADIERQRMTFAKWLVFGEQKVARFAPGSSR